MPCTTNRKIVFLVMHSKSCFLKSTFLFTCAAISSDLALRGRRRCIVIARLTFDTAAIRSLILLLRTIYITSRQRFYTPPPSKKEKTEEHRIRLLMSQQHMVIMTLRIKCCVAERYGVSHCIGHQICDERSMTPRERSYTHHLEERNEQNRMQYY